MNNAHLPWGLPPPNPRDLTRLLPSQASTQNRRDGRCPPTAWSSPGVGAQVASLRCLILRPGHYQPSSAAICTSFALSLRARALRATRIYTIKHNLQEEKFAVTGLTGSIIISGSLRIGINLQFQAHLTLESFFDFRLISGLENARDGCINHNVLLMISSLIERRCEMLFACMKFVFIVVS